MSSIFDHFGYPAPPLGEWRHVKWYNLRLVQEMLEGMQHRVSSGMTPLPSLQVVAPTHREVSPAPIGSQPEQGVTTSGSTPRPEIALKSPRTAAGKPQVASATQKCGSEGGGSKGIHLEDSSAPGVAKRRRQVKKSAKFRSGHHYFEDTFEVSDDSSESFDGPFLGSSSAVAASSTTADAPPAAQ